MFLDRLADKAYERSRAPKTRINPTITRNEAWKSTSLLEGGSRNITYLLLVMLGLKIIYFQ